MDFDSASKATSYHQQVIHLLQEQKPDGTILVRVISGSMRPVLQPDDRLIVKPVPFHSLKRGDIVVMHDAHGLLTHRLLGKQGDYVFTKGDALHWSDAPILAACVLGRVLAIERNGQLARDLTQARQEKRSAWLARLSAWESQVYAQFLPQAETHPTLQKCMAWVITFPLRGMAFLLQ